MESTYNANRYRGQHGQISFITGAPQTPEEHKTNLADTQSAASTAGYALAPVQDFQRRGERNRSRSPPRQSSSNNDVLELDLAQYKQQQQSTIAPYSHNQPPSSRYLSYPASSPVVLTAASSTSQSADSLLPIVYELRSSLVAEQEARKHLEVQLHEVRMNQQAAIGEMKATVGAVGDEVKGGESRWLTLSARVKEMELAASLEGRYNERSDRLDAREQATQQQSVVAAMTELRAQMDEREQRYRDELESTHREYSRTIAAMKEQQLDARQLQDERWQQQMDTMQQRVQLLVDKAESSSATAADVAALVSRLSSVEASSNALETALRQLTDTTRREGEEVSSKGDWLRGVMMEQLEGRAKMVEGKIETVEEGRRLMLAAVQKEITGMRDEMDRRLRDVQSSVATASEHDRQTRDDMELRVQAAVKQAYGSLSTVIKDTVSALSSRLSELESTAGSSDTSIAASVQSMSESHAELESVLRAEVKTRMKSYNKTKAQLDLLSGTVSQLKQMVGTEDGEVRKVAAEVKATEVKLERMKERVREMRAKGEEEMDKERRMVDEVKRRVDGLEEMRRRVEAIEAEAGRAKRSELDDVKRDVDELKRAVAGVDGVVGKSIDRLRSDDAERQQQLQTVVRRMDEADRWMNDQVAQLTTAIDQHEQERNKREQTHRLSTEQYINDQFERLKRTVRDQTRDQLAGHASHTDVHAVTAMVQSVRTEMEERDRSAGHRMDQLARSLRGEMDAVRQSGLVAGAHTEDDDKEAQHLLHIALETRGVLDDMMTAVDQDNQQQAIDAIRQHVNAQLQAVDDRLHACERHVSNALAAQHTDKQSPQIDKLTTGLEAVRARCEQQGSDAQRWHDDLAQQLQHLSLTMLASGGDKREPAAATKLPVNTTATADKHELLAVRAEVASMAGRMSTVEDELSKKVDYSEETHAVLQQQLTGVEVKLSRMEAEWTVLREERERQRNMSVSSNPASARQPAASVSSNNAGEQSWTSVVSQQLSELRAQVSALSGRQGPPSPKMAALTVKAGPASPKMGASLSPKMGALSSSRLALHVPDTARQVDMSAAHSELQHQQQALVQQMGELSSQINGQQQQVEAWKASVIADLQQHVKLLQPSKLPQPTNSARDGSSSARPTTATAINAKLGAMTSQLADVTQQLAAQQEEHRAAKLRTEDRLRQLATEQQQLVHALHQLKDRTRQTTAQSQRGSGTARLSDSEGVLLASLSSHSSPTAAGGQQTELRLQQLEQTLSSQVGELSSRLSQLSRQVHVQEQPAVSEAADVAADVQASPAPTNSPQLESSAAVGAQIAHLQQAMVAQMDELSGRIDELASAQADITQQLTALVTNTTAPISPLTPANYANTAASDHTAIDSASAAAQPVDSAAISARTEQWNSLSSEVEFLKQQLPAQVGEMSNKMAQLQSQLDSLTASSATERLSHQQPLSSRQSTNTTAAAAATSSGLPASTTPTTAVSYDSAALDRQLQHLKHSMTGQLDELSFRLSNAQQALRDQLSGELQTVHSSYQQLHQQLEHIKDTLASSPPRPITALTASAAPTTTPPVDSADHAAAIAHVDSRVEHLQQAVTVQVTELSHRLNELTTKLQQLPPPQPSEPSTTPASLQSPLQPADSSVPPLSSIAEANAQPGMSPTLTSRRSSQGLASSTPVQAAIEAAQTQWQQQFKALAADIQAKLDTLQHITQQPISTAQPNLSTVTALESELAATSNRVSSLVAHVQRMEESAATLRSTEAAEMEDIVSRITAIYKKSKDDIAGLQEAVVDLRHGVDAKEVQLKRLDEQVVDDIRRLMDDLVRVEGEGKGERLLMQRKLREIEHAVQLLNSKLSGRPAQPAADPRDIKSARTHVASPRRAAGGGDGDAVGASKLSFLSPANGGRVQQHGRSVSSIEGTRESAVEVAAGRPDSQQAITPRHHPHISIELTTPLPQPSHSSDSSSTDDMYDQQTTPKPSDENSINHTQPRDTTASPQPLQQPLPHGVTAFHSRGLSIEVNAAPLSFIQQQVHPQSPFSPLMSTRSLHQSPQHSSPQHRTTAADQPPLHPQHRQQQSEPNLQPQLNQSPPQPGKGKPSSRAQPQAVQTDRPVVREQQRRTSASKRLVDMATSPMAQTAEMKTVAQSLFGAAELGGLSVSGSAVSGGSSAAGVGFSLEAPAKRPSLTASAAAVKHGRTQSGANRLSAGTYETKLQ